MNNKINEFFERYFNSENEDIVNDFVKLNNVLEMPAYKDDWEDDDYYIMRKKVCKYFSNKCKVEGVELLKAIPTTDRTKAGITLMEEWTYSQPEQRQDVMEIFNKSLRKATLLEMVKMLETRDIYVRRLKKVKPDEVANLQFEVPVEANSYIDDAINSIKSVESSVDELLDVYLSVGSDLAHRIKNETELKTKNQKNDAYGKFFSVYLKKLNELGALEPDYTSNPFKYYGSYSDYYCVFVSLLLNTESTKDVIQDFVDTLQFRAKYHLNSDKDIINVLSTIRSWMELDEDKNELINKLNEIKF